MPIWLGGPCSNKTLLLCRLAIVPNVPVEHLHSKRCDKLKYVQAEYPQYQHLKIVARKSEKLVQETFSQGGKLY
jgi:hypothetical protein